MAFVGRGPHAELVQKVTVREYDAGVTFDDHC